MQRATTSTTMRMLSFFPLVIALLFGVLLFGAGWALARVPLPPGKGIKITAGWIEYITVPELEDAKFRAKLDTGAETSSINAEIIAINRLEDNEKVGEGARHGSGNLQGLGRSIVIFAIKDDKGDKKTLERELVRWSRIKKKEGGFVERPVIKFSFCIAGDVVEGEVNLAAREHFQYPVLIGRNMLRKRGIVVDSSRTYRTTRLGCLAPSSKAKDTTVLPPVENP
jgi:hypothetical protein